MSSPKKPTEPPGWFDKKRNVRRVIGALFVACVGIVVLDGALLMTGHKDHAYFQWEEWPGFYAVFGFVACVILVLISKWVLRPLAMKDEDFYDR